MKLKEIHIKNFRGIKNQKIESIEDALILIGKNNAGKSAFYKNFVWRLYTSG